MARILVIDDDSATRQLLVRGLKTSSHDIEDARDGDAGLALLEKREYDVVVTDLRMSAKDGMDILNRCLELRPSPAVILMSGYGTIEVAIAAIKRGAFDFVQKPFDLQHMLLKIDQALEMRRLKYQVDYLTAAQSPPGAFGNIVGADGTLLRALMIVSKVARSNASILILGETGTGKELIASAVHHSSERAGRAFVKVNCAALHEQLLESELFGHEKGAFTSADRQRLGRFEQADGGTMFLDEIGDMSLSTQAKVLRVLQEHEFERLGSSKTLKVNVRILAATHRNLAEMVTAGTFRADLFYRLNVVSIDLPPLRERKDDIPALARHFVSQLCADLKKPIKEIGADALAALTAHRWPGNIRELQNVLERALLLGDGPVLRAGDLTFG